MMNNHLLDEFVFGVDYDEAGRVVFQGFLCVQCFLPISAQGLPAMFVAGLPNFPPPVL